MKIICNCLIISKIDFNRYIFSFLCFVLNLIVYLQKLRHWWMLSKLTKDIKPIAEGATTPTAWVFLFIKIWKHTKSNK